MKIKSAFIALRNGFTDFRSGLSVIFSKPEKGEGDRKLAKKSKEVTALISFAGKDIVRTQLIKQIKRELKQKAKKGGKDAVEKCIQNVVKTPEYMQMIHELDLDESHIRIMAMEALKKHEK